MKRHDALAPLSRDHFRALNLAEGLKRDGRGHLRDMLPADTAGRVAHVRRAFEEDLDPHFRAEEEVLLRATRGRDAELDAVWERVLEQHREMHAMLAELEGAQDAEEVLDRLGRLLVEHVRLEERELFPLCERVLSEDELAAFGFVEAEAERGRACPTPTLD